MAFLKATIMFTCTTHSKRFLLENFKCTVYHFSIRSKLEIMGKSCGEYCATPPGIDKVYSAAHWRYFGRVEQIYVNWLAEQSDNYYKQVF